MRGPARLATYIAVAMSLAGFAVIYLAWSGAAELDRPTAQFPYLISGGLVGLGLIIAAMAILYLQIARQLMAERAVQMKRLNDAMTSVLEAARKGTFVPHEQEAPEREATEAKARVPASVAATSATDNAAAGAAASPDADAEWGPADTDTGSKTVIAGRSSFHAPSCHLVAARDDLEQFTRDEAEYARLNPCRICKP
jgi:hypothetical protein